MSNNLIRKPAVAGMFYPADKNELSFFINDLLAKNIPHKSYNNIIGIVAPHAGYIYSGSTAAFAFNAIKHLNIKNVYVLSPSHREFFNGICVYSGDYYQTPLGNIPVNAELANAITQNAYSIFLGTKGHGLEHALEVELPFLQTIYSDFTLIPIVIGYQKKEFLDELAQKLATVWDDSSIVVASSDLSHFHDVETAKKLDNIVINRINTFDFDGLIKDLEKENCEACGGGAIYTLMKLANLLNYNKAEVLHRTDSSEVTKDKSEVVGYLAAIVYKN